MIVGAISIVNQTARSVQQDRIHRAVELVLEDAKCHGAEVNVAIVDDSTIWELNRRHLQHDYPTDVLSFRLDDNDGSPLEGEIIVSIDTAEREALHYHWSADAELLLYVIHGALHLVGYDDSTEALRAEMREAERRILALLETSLAEQHAKMCREHS